MNKTIIININSIVFHIEEDAYDMLRAYMIDIKKHFGRSEDSKEILSDIENRIAEMFNDKIQSGKKEVINIQDVEEVITQMGRVADFELDEETASTQEQTNTQSDSTYQVGKKLMRDPDDKILGGICSGLGHYFGIEARWIRLLFALLFLFAGTGFLFYIILWIIMPLARTRVDKMEMRGEAPNIQNFKKNFEEEMNTFGQNFSGAGASVNEGVRTAGSFIGNILILFVKVIGVLFAFSIGLTLLGMMAALIFGVFGIANINSDGIETFNIIGEHHKVGAFLSGFFTIAIPLIGIFYFIIRILFNKKPMNNYLSVGLFVAFLVSLSVSAYYVSDVVRDFQEKSIITQEKTLANQDTYYFSLTNTREIKVSESDDRKSSIRQNFLNGNSMQVKKDDISIRFESLDSLAKPYIRYEYSAKGKNYKIATLRASNIDYKTQIDSNNISFDSHFNLLNEELFRDQEVKITVFLPKGAKVVLDKSIRWKVRDVPYDNCYPDDDNNLKQTNWKMTERGIRCAVQLLNPKTGVLEDLPEIPEIDDIDHVDEIHEVHGDTQIDIDANGVSIKTKKRD